MSAPINVARPINYIGISVNKIEEFTRWYDEMLGFKLFGDKIMHIKRRDEPDHRVFKIYPESLQEVKLAYMSTGNSVGFEVFEFVDPVCLKAEDFDYSLGGFFHLCVTDPDPEALLAKVLRNGAT